MPTVIHNAMMFFKLAAKYLKEAPEAENGQSQIIRAKYTRELLSAFQIEISGPSQEEIEKNGACIYVANHSSTLDALMICAFFEGNLRILAKESLYKIPRLGTILRLEKHIMVHRGKDAHDRNQSIRQDIQTAVREGASVFIFPEGTRTRTGELGPFKHGAFYNAIQCQVPVVPVIIEGTFEAMPPGSLRVKPGKCSLRLLPAIQLPEESMGDESARAHWLADQARNAIIAGIKA